MAYEIYYDSYQEGQWFRGLHSALAGASLEPFPRTPSGRLAAVLSFDRPDIILARDTEPILVIERTVEVPSGHNVGQRFARLAAAAIEGVPCVYFGPYAAYKHGGETSGPRFMNLRLFKALRNVELLERSPVTTVRWPTDDSYELVMTSEKDEVMREYLALYFALLADIPNVRQLGAEILASPFEKAREAEREDFIAREVKRAAAYDAPPNSLSIGRGATLDPEMLAGSRYAEQRVAVYDVGMTNIRSDPYTGMALLYSYLYCGGLRDRTMPLILRFPNVTQDQWRAAALRGGNTKTIRLFRLAADAIIFADAYLERSGL